MCDPGKPPLPAKSVVTGRAAVLCGLLLYLIELSSAQAQEPTAALRDNLLDQNVDALNIFLFHFFVTLLLIIIIVLLLKTAAVKKSGRFLQHMAGAFTVGAVAHFGAMVAALFKERIAMNGLITCIATQESINRTADAIKLIQTNWDAADLVLSFFSTFWLILTWDLIKQYPKQGISEQFFATAAVVLAAAIGLPTLLLTVLTDKAFPLVQMIDALSSAIALCLVGLALAGIYPTNLPIAANQRLRILNLATGLLYLLWGTANLLYNFLHQRLMFSVIVFLIGYIAVLLTVISCALIMEDKQEYAVA